MGPSSPSSSYPTWSHPIIRPRRIRDKRFDLSPRGLILLGGRDSAKEARRLLTSHEGKTREKPEKGKTRENSNLQ
jgi:hypothetical protein